MGGNPSKKSNFQECYLTQEQIDKIYHNFSEFSKLKDGKSGTYISQRGLQKVVKPNKELGRKIHEFLAQQSVSQNLTFDTFLYFVEFFLQGQTYIRQDLRYRDYSITEMFGMLSFYSSLTKNRQSDKDYINRLKITYRQGLEFFIEIHLILGALNGKYKWDRDENIPKKHNSFVFGDKYEMNFSDFILAVKTKYTNLDKLLQIYFQRTFYHNKPYVIDHDHKEKHNPPPKTSELFNHNAITNLTLSVNQFSEFPYREQVYNAAQERFNFDTLIKSIQTFQNNSLLLVVSHLAAKPAVNEEEEHIASKTKMFTQGNTERQTYGIFLPKSRNQQESFLTLSPHFQVYPNTNGKQNFFNMDQTAIVIFFGEEENDLMFLHNELSKQSYIKSTKPEFATNGDQPVEMKIDQIELWVLSDEQLDLSLLKSVSPNTNTTIVKEQVITAQPMSTSYTVTNTQPQQQSVVVERNVTREYYVTSSNQQYYQTNQIKDVK